MPTPLVCAPYVCRTHRTTHCTACQVAAKAQLTASTAPYTAVLAPMATMVHVAVQGRLAYLGRCR